MPDYSQKTHPQPFGAALGGGWTEKSYVLFWTIVRENSIFILPITFVLGKSGGNPPLFKEEMRTGFQYETLPHVIYLLTDVNGNI